MLQLGQFDVTLTDDAYWASVPDEVRTTMMPVRGSGEAAETAAQRLAIKGYLVDRPIMIYGWSAPLVMAQRLFWYRLKFVQSISAEPLPGKIKVSVDIADYLPVHLPKPPVDLIGLVDQVVTLDKDGNVVNSVPNLLWVSDGKRYFAPGPGCYGPHGVVVVDGKDYVENGVTYTADVRQDVMGLFRVFMTTQV